MQTQVIPEADAIDLASIEFELRPKSTEELRFRFHECFDHGARMIAEASICVKLMKERGESLQDIPLRGVFLRIAAGQILPELIWQFMESPGRQEVERLPLDDQKRLVANPMVPVVEPKPGGGYTKRMVDLTKAPKEVAKLVAGPDGIRPVEEQMAYLGTMKAKAGIVRATPKDEEPDIREALDRQVTVRLTASEMEALQVRAARSRCSVPEIARRFMLQSGAFKQV